MNALCSNSYNMDWKSSHNVCLCCTSSSCHKNVSQEYYVSGQKEVYFDMFKDTFGLEICPMDSKQNAGNQLICDQCIDRLRDASQFKLMVINSNSNLSLQIEQSKVEPNQGIDINNILEFRKCDPVKEEPEISAEDLPFDFAHHDADDSFDDNEILANIKLELSRGDIADKIPEDTNIGRSPKRRKYSKGNIKETEHSAKLKLHETWSKISERRGNGPMLRENSLKLLANSTICAFQWNKSRYRCFCCDEPFSDMTLLRQHSSSEHTLKNIEKKIIVQQNRLVKVEVSKLSCKLCETALDNLADLRHHLSNRHDVEFCYDEDLLVPFRLETGSLQCQICCENFTKFRHLNIHMNRHFQKQVCHICGAAFSNLVFLNLHKTRSHRPFKCKECGIEFLNRSEKKQHDMAAHNVKFERKLRFPCPFCSERFVQENLRVYHLVEKHGIEKPEYKCSMCSKVFVTRSLCNNHMKNVHMKEKRCECDICHMRFYTKSDVNRHRVTHTGEKNFSCGLCNNLFATKDSLRRHLKRTHGSLN